MVSWRRSESLPGGLSSPLYTQGGDGYIKRQETRNNTSRENRGREQSQHVGLNQYPYRITSHHNSITGAPLGVAYFAAVRRSMHISKGERA